MRNLKIWVRLTAAIWLVLVLVWTGMILWQSSASRESAIVQANDFARSVHEITMAGLTGMMITGTIDRREIFLDQIKQLSAIKNLSVSRSAAVEKIFGPDTKAAHVLDSIEQEVIREGKPYSKVTANGALPVLRVITPVLASKSYLGKDCISCHQVPEGTVLGLVRMDVSLETVENELAGFRLKISLAAAAASLLLLFVIYRFTHHFVTRPLNFLDRSLQEIARGEGDLTRRLAIRGDDEIGQTAHSFNEMMENFCRLIRQIRDSATHLSSQSQRLAESAQRVTNGSTMQNEKSVQAASAIENMVSRIGAISNGTEAVHRQSQESQTRAEEGNRALEQLGGEMAKVEGAVTKISTAVTQFVENSEAIYTITQKVKGVADQTNLLALNASIEAARAGDAGRGFAVVADEVRKLAEQSAHSANEIDAITKNLSVQSERVRQAIDEGLTSIATGHQAVDSVADILRSENGSVFEVGRGLDAIAAETEEQKRIGHELVAHIEAISEMTRQNTSEISQTSMAVQELDALAQDLHKTVHRFKV